MKHLFAGMAAALLAAIFLFSMDVQAVSARNAILVDATTGRILYEKSADEKALIASTTKIMTALIVCEQCNVLDRMRIPKEAVGIEGSSIYLREGEVMTIQELLYGLMLHSGNDAAVALAIYCGGTVEGFVQLMNDKAHLLGLRDTHFANPNGLDHPDHYSTARDMAKLTVYAMRNPIFAKTVATKSVSVAGRSLRNHNKLLWRVEGADGVKTGFTRAAGRILVSSAVREGRRLICVTMNDPRDWTDHETLIDGGFSKYSVQNIVLEGQELGEVEVVGGSLPTTRLIAQNDFCFSVREDEIVEVVVPNLNFVYAPVVCGQDAGFAYACIDGKPVGRIPLCFDSTVEIEKVEKQSFWERLFGGK